MDARHYQLSGWGLLLFSAIVYLLFGIFLTFNPAKGGSLFVQVMGISLIFAGIENIIFTFYTSKRLKASATVCTTSGSRWTRIILSTDRTSVFAARRDARAIIPIPQLTHAIPRKHTKTRRFTTSPESFSRPPQTDGAFYACYLIPGIYPNTGTCPLRPILYFSTSFLEKCVSKK